MKGFGGDYVVWKYQIPDAPAFTLVIPGYQQVVHVGLQAGNPCMWVICKPADVDEVINFTVKPTGGYFNLSDEFHVGSWVDMNNEVWHLFMMDDIEMEEV